MKIISLAAENVKRLRAVEITPKGDLIKITGKNGAGKSSVLDAIFWALGGTKTVQSVPIRRGAEKAYVSLDLGKLVVTRRFSPKGSTLTVENAEGARYTSPQQMLDQLVGALTFDPLAFSRMEPKAQFEALRQIVKLDVDVDQLEGLNRRDFDDRTEINRDAKTRRAQSDGIAVPPDLPDEPIDAKALMDQMAAGAEVNGSIERRKANRESATAAIAERRQRADRLELDLPARITAIETKATERVGQLQRQIDALLAEQSQLTANAAAESAEARDDADAEAKALRQAADELQAKLDAAGPLPEPVDVAALRADIDRAGAINAGIEKRTRRAALVAEAEEMEARAADLTQTIDARKAQKAKAIAEAPMPVAGLSFGDGIILYNGVPFDQASTAEQLRISTAIAMAGNPELKVLRIKQGNDLDEDGLQLLAEMAAERGFQVWLEKVDSTGKIGIYIEDGAVAAVNEDLPPDPPPSDRPAGSAAPTLL